MSVELHSLDRMCISTIYFVVDFKFSNFALDGVDRMILHYTEQTVRKTGPRCGNYGIYTIRRGLGRVSPPRAPASYPNHTVSTWVCFHPKVRSLTEMLGNIGATNCVDLLMVTPSLVV